MSEIGASENLIACIGCGALVSDIEGPTHEYIGALAGCWAIYSEVQAKEYTEYLNQFSYGASVDTYAVQHPGIPGRRSIQSVAVHLISLLFVLERGFDFQQATDIKKRALQQREKFVWLEPPDWAGVMTIVDVAKASNAAEHGVLVRQWAEAVWQAWAAHHETVKRWAALLYRD